MSATLKHISGGQVRPVDDARLYNLMLKNQAGIVEGCEITHLGSNQLQISAGWGVCYGRVFSVEQEIINANVSTSGTMKGRLLLHIDITSDTPAVFQTQAAVSLPELVQENINSSGTIYEIEFARYDIDQILITDLDVTAPVVESPLPSNENALNGMYTYIHTRGTLSGSGVNGKFKATVTETVSSLSVNGTRCTVKCGEDNEMELIAGCWYTFILDGSTVNFRAGGSLSNKKLAQATAIENVVRAGYTFYAGDKKLRTGKAKCMATVETSTEDSAREYTYTATFSGNILAVFSYGDRTNDGATIECVCSNSDVVVRELAEHSKTRGSSDYRYAKAAVGIYLAEGIKEGDTLTFIATDEDKEYQVPVCLVDIIKLYIGAGNE